MIILCVKFINPTTQHEFKVFDIFVFFIEELITQIVDKGLTVRASSVSRNRNALPVVRFVVLKLCISGTQESPSQILMS